MKISKIKILTNKHKKFQFQFNFIFQKKENNQNIKKMKEPISAKNEVVPSLERSTYREKYQIDLSQDRNLDTSNFSCFLPFNAHFL